MHYFTHGGLKKWHSSRDLDGERESWESSWRESIAGSRSVPGRGACWVLWSMTRRPMKGDGEAETLPWALKATCEHLGSKCEQKTLDYLTYIVYTICFVLKGCCVDQRLCGSRQQSGGCCRQPREGLWSCGLEVVAVGAARWSGFQSSSLCGVYVKEKSRRWLSGVWPKKLAG